MAGTTPTTYARDVSSRDWFGQSLRRLQGEIEICKYRYGLVLMDLAREAAKEQRDEKLISDLIDDAREAADYLDRAREDLSDAEECA